MGSLPLVKSKWASEATKQRESYYVTFYLVTPFAFSDLTSVVRVSYNISWNHLSPFLRHQRLCLLWMQT
jgi:hypothetical protein